MVEITDVPTLLENQRQLEDFVRRAYELLLATDHRIPEKQVVIHNLVRNWQNDLEQYAGLQQKPQLMHHSTHQESLRSELHHSSALLNDVMREAVMLLQSATNGNFGEGEIPWEKRRDQWLANIGAGLAGRSY